MLLDSRTVALRDVIMAGPFDSFDGIRTISLAWIVLGHTYGALLGGA